jgi:hypothetical protein
MDEQRGARVGGMTVTLCFDLSRVFAAEATQYEKRDPVDAKRVVAVTDPAEHERLLGISETLENVALALVQWRNACSPRR